MRGIWAVARSLILEVIRMRILMIFILLSVSGYTLLLAFWLRGKIGPMDEKVQTFLSYSLSFSMGFQALLTIFIAIATITRDIKRKEIFTIATKPLKRIHYLFGKLLGVALFNLVLLLGTTALIYGLILYLSYGRQVPADERDRLEQLVLVARRAIKPEMPDINEEVKKWVDAKVREKLQDQPDIYRNNPDQVDQMRHVLAEEKTKELSLRHTAVPPARHIVWHFTGIKPPDPEKGYVFVRFKQEVDISPPDYHIFNDWAYGPQNPLIYGGTIRPRTRDVVRTVHEFPIPVSAVSDQGDLYVMYRNPTLNGNSTVIYPPDTGIEVLFVVGSFTGNFFRAVALIFLRLIFLTIVSLAMGAWLSYPVAVLVVLVVYLLGLTSGFIADALQYEVGDTLRTVISIIMGGMPSLSAWDPVPMIEKGRIVSLEIGPNIARALDLYLEGKRIPTDVLTNLLFVKDMLMAGCFAVFGYLVFRFRELARVIV